MVLSFWKVTCDECVHQLRVFSDLLRARPGRGLVVVAIAVDGPQSRAQVRVRAADAGIDFPVLVDEDSTVFNHYDPHHDLPFTLIVNRDGSVRARYPGLYFTALGARLLGEVDAALAAPTP
jgi:peroxiredoxin